MQSRKCKEKKKVARSEDERAGRLWVVVSVEGNQQGRGMDKVACGCGAEV